MSVGRTDPRPRDAVSLWLLLTLFVVRVVAQPLALVVSAPLLPPFDAWQSGAVPYPLLLASQIVILVLLVAGARAVSGGIAQFRRRIGLVLLGLGTMYFVTMVARLVLGATVLQGHAWFDRPVPAVFHLVLATWVLVYGRFQHRYGV